MEKRPFIATYIQASRPFGVLYIGMTANLYARAQQHREGVVDGFSRKHGCSILVWYQQFWTVPDAIRREKALKRWNRPWKMQLIEQRNPDWRDLHPFLVGQAPDPRLPVAGDQEGSVEAFLKWLRDGGEDGEA
ncbi:excinuclease ABC subunit C [Brevundimonas sp. Root1279]|nr:excinuclease ABC subunit C [Brevundimonas sp. Root1279]